MKLMVLLFSSGFDLKYQYRKDQKIKGVMTLVSFFGISRALVSFLLKKRNDDIIKNTGTENLLSAVIAFDIFQSNEFMIF